MKNHIMKITGFLLQQSNSEDSLYFAKFYQLFAEKREQKPNALY